MAVFPHSVSSRRAVHVRSGAHNGGRLNKVSKKRKLREKVALDPRTAKKEKQFWRCRLRRRRIEAEKGCKQVDIGDEDTSKNFDHLRVFQRWFQRPALNLVDQWMERVGFY